MPNKTIKKAIESIKESSKKKEDSVITGKTSEVSYIWDTALSTGSTVLDLAISGGRCHFGGIPGGVIVEIFGKSSAGKSSILSELGSSAQAHGGEADFQDPEARLDSAYCQTYGLQINNKNYSKPDTVSETFNHILGWQPPENKINCSCVDSLAALSTNLELEKGDTMGMRRAKEFSEGLRKVCRIIEKNKWVLACTNQVRDGKFGDVTPGGRSVEFYSSLRVKVVPIGTGKILKTKKLSNGKEVKKIIGVSSQCTVVKSSLDDPYRSANIYIVFGYGIDDIRGNLQYIKDHTKDTKYNCFDKSYVSMDAAIQYIEENNLVKKLQEEVIGLWNEIENLFKSKRIRKIRQ